MKTSKYDLCIKIATHLLTLPIGAWPETQSCELQLAENLPHGVTREQILAVAARTAPKIREEWANAEPFCGFSELYPFGALPGLAPALWGKS